MANIKSAKKRILVSRQDYEENRNKKSAMKTAIKNALNNADSKSVSEAYKRIDKALAKNIITKNKAARMKARVSKKLNSSN